MTTEQAKSSPSFEELGEKTPTEWPERLRQELAEFEASLKCKAGGYCTDFPLIAIDAARAADWAQQLMQRLNLLERDGEWLFELHRNLLEEYWEQLYPGQDLYRLLEGLGIARKESNPGLHLASFFMQVLQPPAIESLITWRGLVLEHTKVDVAMEWALAEAYLQRRRMWRIRIRKVHDLTGKRLGLPPVLTAI